jgi:hypothetical protein
MSVEQHTGSHEFGPMMIRRGFLAQDSGSARCSSGQANI